MNKQDRVHIFIYKAKGLHGDKYDYSKVVYVTNITKVIIGCRNCGKDFLQTPNSHACVSNPCGCPHCRYERRIQPKPYTTLTTEQFIEKATLIHGNKYTYDNVVYINSASKVDITCPTHGMFCQRPNNHLSFKQGCPKCELENKRKRNNERKTTFADFIKMANVLYDNRYDYNNSVYDGGTNPITILCKMHGDYTVGRAKKHLYGQECPTCCKQNGSSFELQIVTILNKMNITFQREKTFNECRSPITNRKLKYDFFVPSLNILIEFDGIQHSQPVPFFNKNYSFNKCQIHDLTKTQYALHNGYTLIRLTEKTIKTLHQLL